MTEPIRILVVDDHPLLRAGIVGIIDDEPDLQVVGEASDGEEAVCLAAELKPDVVCMDLRMPVCDGATATARIARSGPSAPRILVLTTYDTDADILRAVEAGASGYLLKDAPPDVLLRGIRDAAWGQTVLAPGVASRLMNSMRSTAERLTARETEVLSLVAEGYSNAEVGRQLFISGDTVKTHLQRIYVKLGADDRTGAVTEARKRGWLT
ncbi:MAG: response regulator transcription factor [Promicromonosporaceae bacterium]|nr:response regulator transcription factor [Promicromonosporaceae bacterium]